VPALLRSLKSEGLLELVASHDAPITLVVATHPHLDHIRGYRSFSGSSVI
jgi:glyoxylase-like metal-dependent hydrolase (beta-lactamase superfamily II)